MSAADPPYSGQRHPGHPQVTQADVDAAVKAERERIRALAVKHGATYRREHIHSEMDGAPRLHSHEAPFADLIGEAP